MDWFKIKGGAEMPLGEWRRTTPLLSVRGVQYRRREAEAFCKLAIKLHERGEPFGLLIEREPTNEHDHNALKVSGWGAGASQHIGYVEAVEATRSAERYPEVPLAAEFYSLYLGRGGFIDVRFFLSVAADAKARASERVRSLLELTRDELIVLCYAARADSKLGRLEAEVLNRYAHERARDFQVPLVDQDISDLKKWCREQNPADEEVEMAIHRLVDDQGFNPAELWGLIEIVLSVDGRISKRELSVARQISQYMREALAAT